MGKAARSRGKRKAESGPGKAFVRPPLPADADLSYISADIRALALPIDLFQPDPQNENKHDDASIRAIAASLRELGQRSNISGNSRTMTIAKGNGTWRAAKSLGWEYIAIAVNDDDEVTHTAYRIADNQAAKFSDFDEELLQHGLELLKEEKPDLFADLELADLEGSAAPAAAKEVEVTETFALLVEVENEASQKKWFAKLSREKGLKVQVRTI